MPNPSHLHIHTQTHTAWISLPNLLKFNHNFNLLKERQDVPILGCRGVRGFMAQKQIWERLLNIVCLKHPYKTTYQAAKAKAKVGQAPNHNRKKNHSSTTKKVGLVMRLASSGCMLLLLVKLYCCWLYADLFCLLNVLFPSFRSLIKILSLINNHYHPSFHSKQWFLNPKTS